MLTPTVRRTLAPRGQTPILPCWDRHDRISVISAITVSPTRERLGLYFHLLPDNENVHAEDVVPFIQTVKYHLRRPMTILWDRISAHDRSKVVQGYLRKHSEIVTEEFPSYAPELNPDEQVWTYIKYGRLANYAPKDIHDLRCCIEAELNRLRKRSDLLAAFIRRSNLPWQNGEPFL